MKTLKTLYERWCAKTVFLSRWTLISPSLLKSKTIHKAFPSSCLGEMLLQSWSTVLYTQKEWTYFQKIGFTHASGKLWIKLTQRQSHKITRRKSIKPQNLAANLQSVNKWKGRDWAMLVGEMPKSPIQSWVNLEGLQDCIEPSKESFSMLKTILYKITLLCLWGLLREQGNFEFHSCCQLSAF